MADWTDHGDAAPLRRRAERVPSRRATRPDDQALARMLGASLLLGTAMTGAAGWGLWSLVAALIP